MTKGDNRNLKKEFQFFPTPNDLADLLVSYAAIPDSWNKDNASPNVRILEPSAGQGAIIDAIDRRHGITEVYCYELMDINRKILKEKYPNLLLAREKDFLENETLYAFDRIIANPPFSKNQDVDYIYKMFQMLKPGGKLVSVASRHWELSQNNKEVGFATWLKEVDATKIYVESGVFKQSGTNIPTVIIMIEKPFQK